MKKSISTGLKTAMTATLIFSQITLPVVARASVIQNTQTTAQADPAQTAVELKETLVKMHNQLSSMDDEDYTTHMKELSAKLHAQGNDRLAERAEILSEPEFKQYAEKTLESQIDDLSKNGAGALFLAAGAVGILFGYGLSALGVAASGGGIVSGIAGINLLFGDDSGRGTTGPGVLFLLLGVALLVGDPQPASNI